MKNIRVIETPPPSIFTGLFNRLREPWSSDVRREWAPQDFLPALPAALVSWFLTIVFSVSLAALIFRGPLGPWLPFGIGMSLFTAFIVGLITALTSSVPGVIAIPSDRTAPMLAILTASIAATFSTTGGDPQVMFATCLVALILTTFLAGTMLALLGRYRLGRLIRFLPFPVVGGFMAGAGWLLVKGALTVLTGYEITIANSIHLLDASIVPRWMPSAAMAIALILATRRLRHFLVIPTIVIASVILFYVVAACEGFSLQHLREIGWLPALLPHEIAWHPVAPAILYQADWFRIFQQSGTIAAILLVSAISMLMICSALELAGNMEVEADRELETAGLANIVATLGGGLLGFHSLSVSTLVLRIGPRSRWVGLLAAVGTAATLAFNAGIVSYLPVPVLGGLLLFLGLNFLTEWLFDSYRRLPRSDYGIIVLILIVVAWSDYIVGVGVGLILALALFALRYSRIDVVRFELCGSRHRSNVDRTPTEQEILHPMRPSIYILKLQGFIFFGTAHSLLRRVLARTHDAKRTPMKYLVMDFLHVTGLDSSTLLSFSKLLQASKRSDFEVICTNVPPRVLRTLRRDPALFGEDGLHILSDVDHAMEWCESRTLDPHRHSLSHPAPPVELLLEHALGKPSYVPQVVTYFVSEKAPAGTVLATQGDRTRDLFLVQHGQVSAQFKPALGPAIRLRTMGPGSIVGEIGLYLDRPRTASIIVETDSVIWRLTPEALATMEEKNPQAAAALHQGLARMVAARLVQANELIETALH